jgi:hypothetical protein
MTMIKSILNFTILCLLANINLKAQDSAKPLDWKSYYKDDKVEIFYKYADCDLPKKGTHEENIYFQFINLTSETVKVEWSKELWYGDKCFNCDGNNKEFIEKINLNPLEVLSGECNPSESLEKSLSKNPLKIFSRFIDLPGAESQLSKFNLKNIKIEIVKL